MIAAKKHREPEQPEAPIDPKADLIFDFQRQGQRSSSTLSKADSGTSAISRAQEPSFRSLPTLSLLPTVGFDCLWFPALRDTTKRAINNLRPNELTPCPPLHPTNRLSLLSCRSQHCMRHRGLLHHRLHPTCPWSADRTRALLTMAPGQRAPRSAIP
mgnify:CR=1 FL=1